MNMQKCEKGKGKEGKREETTGKGIREAGREIRKKSGMKRQR